MESEYRRGEYWARVYLFALLVKVNPERWVFLLKPVQGARKVGSLLSLRRNREGNYRFGDEHRRLKNSEDEREREKP